MRVTEKCAYLGNNLVNIAKHSVSKPEVLLRKHSQATKWREVSGRFDSRLCTCSPSTTLLVLGLSGCCSTISIFSSIRRYVDTNFSKFAKAHPLRIEILR